MLQVIFGDDEHTAADGPYSRLLKTRKWLYLSSAAGIGVAAGLYNENAAEKLLKVVKLPVSALQISLLFGLAYLLIQYILLLWQLIVTYDIVLSERFTFRRSDDLAAARKLLEQANREYDARVAEYRADSSAAIAQLQQEARAEVEGADSDLRLASKATQLMADQKAPDKAMTEARHAEGRAKAVLAAKRAAARILSDPVLARSKLNPASDSRVRLAGQMRDEAQEALYELQRQVPSIRKGYKAFETAIDVFRIAPPAIFAGIAIWSLL